jgi:predicted transcriptional regulator
LGGFYPRPRDHPHAKVKELDAELKASHGLPLSSFDVLAQLGQAPDGRLQMFELAEAVHLSRSALTRQVDRLEREGLMERHIPDRAPASRAGPNRYSPYVLEGEFSEVWPLPTERSSSPD